MDRERYYNILKEEWERVDKNNLEEIKRYNEMKRNLRHELDEVINEPPKTYIWD